MVVISYVITGLVVLIALSAYLSKRLPERWLPVIVVVTLSLRAFLTEGPETKTFWFHVFLLAFVLMAIVIRPYRQQPQR